MRSIGIDPGDQAVKVVELDGSYKKTRLLRAHCAPAGAPGADGGTRVDVVAVAARAALDAGMRGDVTLGHACREAVLRTIELPFQGADAIRKVVKAEIEGEIQSQSIDEMVVDFHEIGAGAAGGTKVLVASVPKAGLRAQLAALSAHAIEPENVDLDTMALWRAAHWAGAFAVEGATEADPKRVNAVIDLGARSVKIVLVEGEQLVEMRALRLGDAVVADDLARRHGIDTATAREVAHKCLQSGSDQRFEVASAVPVVAAGEAEPAGDDKPAAAGPARAVTVTHEEVETAHTAYLQRLARELTRFLAASGRSSQLAKVWVTGGASRAPGTHEMLAAVFGVEIQELDVLGRLQHDLPPDEVQSLGPRLATAVGLALGRLGGPEGFQLRQEDLVLTRGFERIKFPLAIACMVALLALFVHWNKKQLELNNLELQIGRTFPDKKDPKKKSFCGQLYALFATGWFEKPEQFRIDQKGGSYTFKELVAELEKTPPQRRISVVHDRLRTVTDNKQKESGISEDVSVESGLAVLVRWSEMLKTVEPELGRFLVTKVHLNMDAKGSGRRLQFTIAFRGNDFRVRRQALARAIDTEIQQPDSPFEALTPAEAGTEKSEVFRDPTSGSVDTANEGAYFYVVMAVKDVFPPFGGGGK